MKENNINMSTVVSIFASSVKGDNNTLVGCFVEHKVAAKQIVKPLCTM